MNELRQVEILALATGWEKRSRFAEDEIGAISGVMETCWYHPHHRRCRMDISYWPDRPPKFLEDLNATHKASMWLVEKMGWEFQALHTFNLQMVIERRRKDLNREQREFWMYEANAYERTEVLLRTLNLWES